MEQISSATAALARLDGTIAGESNPRHRAMLEIYRQHWWGEVTNDMDMIMATLPPDRVHYRFDGHPFVMGGVLEFHTTAEARAMYQRVIDLGDNLAGPFDDERWAFGDWGLMFQGILHGIYQGSMFAGRVADLDPAQRYLISYRSVSLHPMDLERGLMLGEIVYSGAPLRFEPVDPVAIQTVLDI